MRRPSSLNRKNMNRGVTLQTCMLAPEEVSWTDPAADQQIASQDEEEGGWPDADGAPVAAWEITMEGFEDLRGVLDAAASFPPTRPSRITARMPSATAAIPRRLLLDRSIGQR
jgi:hypothetical protein